MLRILFLVCVWGGGSVSNHGSFIRQSLPLEPLFHTQALDALLRGVAIETSELFRKFDSGLAKILRIAEEPQLQDVSDTAVIPYTSVYRTCRWYQMYLRLRAVVVT